MKTILFVLILLYFISWINGLNSNKTSLEKLTAYECGLEPIGDARTKYYLVYYIIGILYLIFDLEIIFLYPLASTLGHINYLGFIFILLFFILLTLAFIYEWYQGALSNLD